MIGHFFRVALAPAFLLLCLVLGGASAAGFWANMGLQLLAVALIAWALIVRRNTPVSSAGKQLIALALLLIVAIAIQLVPLPPGLWSSFPGRAPIAEGFKMLGLPLPWLPISLAPRQTVASALWLLPAFAMLLAIVKLGSFKADWLAWVIVVVTIAAVALGAGQLIGGPASPLYFYDVTNYGVGVGFFSNSNHMATLLVAAVPFLTALYLEDRRKHRSAQRSAALLVILGGSLAVIFVGLIINSSLAGVGLMVPVAAISILSVKFRKKLPAWTILALAAFSIAAVTVLLTAPFGNNLTTEEARRKPESRYTSFSKSLEAAGDFAPFGSGIGTFQNIYRQYEDPTAVTRVFMNHAHSDYIELALETGAAGALVLALFLLWWVRRAYAVWRADDPDYFARAAVVASAAILAHSIVDYPLRTAAISAVFALCCALMAEPRSRVRQRERTRVQEARHLSAD